MQITRLEAPSPTCHVTLDEEKDTLIKNYFFVKHENYASLAPPFSIQNKPQRSHRRQQAISTIHRNLKRKILFYRGRF